MLKHMMTSPFAGENNALGCGEARAPGSSSSAVLFQVIQTAVRSFIDVYLDLP